MKKIICLIMAGVFYIRGIIGSIIPIIPQIPFLCIGTIFLIVGFEEIKDKIIESDLYKLHFKKYVDNNKVLKKIFSKNIQNNK